MGEEQYGLASVLEIDCSQFGMFVRLGTSNTHRPTGSSDRWLYDINMKAAFATMVGVTDVTQANSSLPY